VCFSTQQATSQQQHPAYSCSGLRTKLVLVARPPLRAFTHAPPPLHPQHDHLRLCRRRTLGLLFGVPPRQNKPSHILPAKLHYHGVLFAKETKH
jgi:hypothetical protein